MPVITMVLLAGLFVFAILNRKKIRAAADTLGDLVNDTHVESDLVLFKRKMKLEIQLLKNRIDDLEQGRSPQTTNQEDRPAGQTTV